MLNQDEVYLKRCIKKIYMLSLNYVDNALPQIPDIKIIRFNIYMYISRVFATYCRFLHPIRHLFLSFQSSFSIPFHSICTFIYFIHFILGLPLFFGFLVSITKSVETFVLHSFDVGFRANLAAFRILCPVLCLLFPLSF